MLLEGSKDFMTRTAAFLKNNGIGMVNCSYKRTKKLTVPGEDHPNGALNALWAKEVSDILRELPPGKGCFDRKDSTLKPR